jgi:hypothetical protein
LRKKWEKKGFTKEKTKLWISSKNASPDHYNLVDLIYKKQQTEQQPQILYRPFPSKRS